MDIARTDEMSERLHEGHPLAGIQGFDRALMGSPCRLLHLPEQGPPRRRRQNALQSPVLLAGLASDQPSLRQARHDVGEGCTVDADLLSECGLLQTGLGRDRRENTVLDGGDIEGGAFLGEQGKVDLMQAPNQEAGTGRQGKGLLGAHAS